MIKQLKSFLLPLSFLSLFISCTPSPQEVAETCKTQVIALSGIQMHKKVLNDFFTQAEMGEGVTVEQFVSSLNAKKPQGVKIDKAEVIVDMSAGMNIGIDKSFRAITAVMQRFDPTACAYFHVDDGATPERINEIRSLSDANYLQNPANYKKAFSKLRPAFESATRANDKITIVITDFLLDEGIKTDRRLKNGKFIKEESADNSTWASNYLSKWFLGKNQLLIYPYKYTAPNYYKKNETKNIYYLVFVPKGSISDKLENLKKDFAGIFSETININPADVSLSINEKDVPGSCVSNYNLLRDPGNKTKIFPEYNSQHIPYSFQAIKKNAYSGKPIACNMSVMNGSPFQLNIVTEGYDITEPYYAALATPGASWKKTELFKDAKSKIVNDLACDVSASYALTFKFSPDVAKVNYLSRYQTLAKLLYSRILVKDMSLKPLSASLSWDFESKYGTMQNNALQESIRLALDDYRNKNTNYPVGSLLVSVHDK